jgi:hypothetical protein
MAKINLNEAFLTTRSKNDFEIEKATVRNINRITSSDILEIHNNLLRVLNIQSENDSKYFSIDNFKNFIQKTKQEKRLNEEYKKYKFEAGEKALSKSEWIAQKPKS